MNPEENKAFTRLVTANGLAEADVWKAVLEASGIQVFLRHEAMAAVIPETAGGIAGGGPFGPRGGGGEGFVSLRGEGGGGPRRGRNAVTPLSLPPRPRG